MGTLSVVRATSGRKLDLGGVVCRVDVLRYDVYVYTTPHREDPMPEPTRNDPLPKEIICSVRIPRMEHMLLVALQMARGDETKSDTIREAVRRFVYAHVKLPERKEADNE